jgi:phosphinothricin acetyltransferase
MMSAAAPPQGARPTGGAGRNDVPGDRAAAISIRPARADDLAAIARIYGHHVVTGLASFELEPPSVEEMTRRHADIVGKGYPYIVAERDGAIAGYAYASAYRARPAYRFAVENSVYVDASVKRAGVGRMLLEALIGECERRGYRQMIAVIGDSANHDSIGLHAACGFARIGTLPAIGWKFERWVDSVLMQRALGDGDRTVPPG